MYICYGGIRKNKSRKFNIYNDHECYQLHYKTKFKLIIYKTKFKLIMWFMDKNIKWFFNTPLESLCIVIRMAYKKHTQKKILEMGVRSGF